VGLDPEKAELVLIEAPKPLLNRFLMNQSLGVSLPRTPWGTENTEPFFIEGFDWLSFELKHQGQPLWLYHP
jgi:hypothetical protein